MPLTCLLPHLVELVVSIARVAVLMTARRKVPGLEVAGGKRPGEMERDDFGLGKGPS